MQWRCLTDGLLFLFLCNTAWSQWDSTQVEDEIFPAEIHKIDQDLAGGEVQSALQRLVFLWQLEDQVDPVGVQREELNSFTGKTFLQTNAYTLAATFFQKSFEINALRNGRPDFQRCGAVGAAYLRGKNWEKAELWFRIGLYIAEIQPEEKLHATSRNNIGIYFLEREVPDSAIFYFESALAAWEAYPFDSLFRGSIRDNLAQSLRMQGKQQEALEWYRKNQLTYQDLRKPHSYLQALLGEAAILLETGQPSRVTPLLTQAEQVIPKVDPGRLEPLLESWYQLSIRTAQLTGQPSRVKVLQEDYLAFLDTTLTKYRAASDKVTTLFASLQERNFEKERELQQLKLKQKAVALDQAQQSKNWAQRLAALIILFLLVLGFLIVRTLQLRSQHLQKRVQVNEIRNKLLQSQLKSKALEKENLELKVRLKEQDLTNFALEVEQRTELLQQMEEKLRALQPGTDLHPRMLHIVREMRTGLQNEESHKLIRENIAEVNAEFRSRLLDQYPELSENEVELCGLIRTGMKSKEIASLRKVSDNAVKVARKRLRKKLQLTPNVDLRKFLSNL